MASGEFSADTEKDEELKKKFSSFEIGPVEDEDDKKESIFEKLFKPKKEEEAALESVVLPVVEFEPSEPEESEPQPEIVEGVAVEAEEPEPEIVEPEPATAEVVEDEPDEQEDVVEAEPIVEDVADDVEVPEPEGVEAIEAAPEEADEEVEDEPAVQPGTVLQPEPAEATEAEPDEEEGEEDEQPVVATVPGTSTNLETGQISDVELEAQTEKAEEIAEIEEDIQEVAEILEPVEVEPAGDLLEDELESADEVEEEPKQEEVANLLSAKLVKRIDVLETQRKADAKAQAENLRKSVITAAEKLDSAPNKLQQQLKSQLRNLLEVLGFENVDHSMDMLIAQFGEKFIDQIISQLLRMLRQENQERVSQSKTKKPKHHFFQTIGRYIMHLIHHR